MNIRSMLILSGSLVASFAHAQALINHSVLYTQDFNNLGTTSITATAQYRDLGGINSTLQGWYEAASAASALTASTGSGNAGGAYNFGSAGSSDRALGGLGSGSFANLYHVLRAKNNSPWTYTSLKLGFTGEQWRNGGVVATQSLTFGYRSLGSTAFTNSMLNSTVGNTTVASLQFNSPTTSTTAAALDGNAAANRTVFAAVDLAVNIAPGEEFLLQWVDKDDTGADHGLAIDDVTILATPEPASMLALALGGIAVARRRRK